MVLHLLCGEWGLMVFLKPNESSDASRQNWPIILVGHSSLKPTFGAPCFACYAQAVMTKVRRQY